MIQWSYGYPCSSDAKALPSAIISAYGWSSSRGACSLRSIDVSESEAPRSRSITSLGSVGRWLVDLIDRESWLRLVPAILVTALVFSEIQWSTPNIIGVDGYYHIKIAEVMRLAGWPAPIPFPWLQLTILNPARFTDHHLLFHILLEPFTLLDLRFGAKLAAAAFASLAALAVYGLMVWQRVRWSFLWLLLLFGISGAFLYRLSMTRRQALVLLLLMALVGVAFSRRDRVAVLVGFVFSWVYDGFLLFMLVSGALMLGRWVDDGVYGDVRGWIVSVARGERRWAGWGALSQGARRLAPHSSLFGCATLGVLAGLIINPYTPRSLTFAIEHALPKLVPAGEFVIGVGNEWYPYSQPALFRAAGASLVTLAVGFVPLVLSWRYERRWDGRVVGLALLALGFTILLLRSRRFVEYQPAFAVLFCAYAWSFQVPRTIRQSISERAPSWARVLLILALLIGAAALMRPTLIAAQNSARAARPVDYYAAAARWLQANTPAGSRVFTTDWDDFPMLFFHNTHNTYLVGLDPTYMYQHDPALYLSWRAITRGQVPTPSRTILDRFESRYVLTDRDHTAFFDVASADPGLRLVYRDATAIIFVVEPPPR